MDTTKRYDYKAQATFGHWYGYGYGDTPREAARNLRDAVPSHLRRRAPKDASIVKRQDHEDGSYSYPLSSAAIEGKEAVAVIKGAR